MNILPKKRWHVRTKDNIARVRRDEAQAAQEEKDRERRAQLAEQEARTSFLRQQANSRQALPPSTTSLDDQHDGSVALLPLNTSGTPATIAHVSFISEADKEQKKWGANKEWEEENKQEKEKFEKSIGLLTYLGQSVLDTKGEQPWYAKRRATDDQASSSGQQDVWKDLSQSKSKNLLDPLNDMRKYLKMIEPSDTKSSLPIPKRTNPAAIPSGTIVQPSIIESVSSSSKRREKHSNKSKDKKKKKAKKTKKHKKQSRKRKRSSSSDSSDCVDEDEQRKLATLERLRAERIKREQVERARSEKLVALSRTGDSKGLGMLAGSSSAPPDGRQKYNSQFNPHLAKKPRLEL